MLSARPLDRLTKRPRLATERGKRPPWLLGVTSERGTMRNYEPFSFPLTAVAVAFSQGADARVVQHIKETPESSISFCQDNCSLFLYFISFLPFSSDNRSRPSSRYRAGIPRSSPWGRPWDDRLMHDLVSNNLGKQSLDLEIAFAAVHSRTLDAVRFSSILLSIINWSSFPFLFFVLVFVLVFLERVS